jgi:excisionase family DNA binding protein
MTALLTTEEASRLLSVSPRTLERLRLSGGGPAFYKCGRLVRYRQDDLDSWIASHQRHSTSEEA